MQSMLFGRSRRVSHILAVIFVAGFLTRGNAAADENPWLAIRMQAVQFAEQAQISWKGKFLGDREGNARYNELIRTNALPLKVAEIEELVKQTPTILFPGQTAFGYPQGEAKGSLVEWPAQQHIMCDLAVARMIQGMPESEKTSFQNRSEHASRPLIRFTLGCAFSSISMSGEASAKKWLHDFVFEPNKPSPIHHEIMPLAVPFLIGAPSEPLLNELESLLAAETRKPEADPPGTYSKPEETNWPLIQNLKSAIATEKYCRDLPAEEQKEFREFYLRFRQTLAFAPTGLRGKYHGEALYTAERMQHLPSDTKYYQFWWKNQEVTELEAFCIDVLRRKYGSPAAAVLSVP